MKTPFVQQQYEEVIREALRKELGLSNVHEVPALKKIVLNSGFRADKDKNGSEEVRKALSLIGGQNAVLTRARKSISNFKLRAGMPIGAKVTLRRARMYDFFYRLVAVVLPNVRDFRGLSPKMDGTGNYNLGIEDSSVFPELRSRLSSQSLGLDITMVTSSSKDEGALKLLTRLGMPFRKVTASTP